MSEPTGTVCVVSLSGADGLTYDLRRPVNAIAVDPTFGKRGTHYVITGGLAGSLILHEKGWLGARETSLYSGSSPIWTIRWSGPFVAWATDEGVRILEFSTQQRIGFISRAASAPRADLFRISLRWTSDHSLLIAWADQVTTAYVRAAARSKPPTAGRTAQYSVETGTVLQLDCMIAGIAMFGNDYLILAYPTDEVFENEATTDRDEQRRKAGILPELRVVQPDGVETSSDALNLAGHARFRCADYRLESSAGGEAGSVAHVLSPSALLAVSSRDDGDHIDWLLERRDFGAALDALDAAGSSLLSRFDRQAIGTRRIDDLLQRGARHQ